NCFFTGIERGAEKDLCVIGFRLVDPGLGVGENLQEQLVRLVHMTGYIGALEAFEVEIEGQFITLAPSARSQDAHPASEIAESRVVRSRIPRPAPGGEVEPRNFL